MSTCREIQFLLKKIQLQNDVIIISDYILVNPVFVFLYKQLLLHVLPHGSVFTNIIVVVDLGA